MIGCAPVEWSFDMKRMLVAAFMVASGAAVRGDEPRERSEAKVSRVLVAHCEKCHGADKQRGGFDVRSVDAILRGSKTGKVVTPGRPEVSLLLRLVAADGDPHMPPKKQLTPTEI